MAITYDLRKLDIENLSEWFERKEFSDKYTNWDFFQSFVFRLTVLRPTDTGTITIDAAKLAIERNHIWEAVAGGVKIPDMFIRRMIGLETNIFPAHSHDEFLMTIGRDVFSTYVRDFYRERINF